MNAERLEKIRQLLTAAFEPITLELIDESHKHIGHAGASAGGGHFAVTIASDFFNDKKILECHRMIYAALGIMMNNDIHALKIKIL